MVAMRRTCHLIFRLLFLLDGSPSPGLIPLGQIKQEPDLHTPSRRRAKLKPDLKLKCGACGQVGHRRTNKACPLYTGGGAVTPEHDEPAPEPDDLDLVYVDGTKLTLPSKFVKHNNDLTMITA